MKRSLTLPVMAMAWLSIADADGTIILTFGSCSSGTVEYDIPSINRTGIVPTQ